MMTVRSLYNHLRSPTFIGLTREGRSGKRRQNRGLGKIPFPFRKRAKAQRRRRFDAAR